MANEIKGAAGELYAKLTEAQAPKSVKSEAGKMVRPFANTKAKVPEASSVDWAEFSADLSRVKALLALWQREVDEGKLAALIEDDEEALMVGLL